MIPLANKKLFNENLAHLFYAVAMADKRMDTDEKKKIVSIVEKNWIDNTNNQQNKEAIYQTIRELIQEHVSSEEAFNKFKLYVTANKELFTNDLSKRIIKASHSICESFANKNKSELILLAKIHKLLLTNGA
ncbi:hypothetical protein [Tenacibaculum sp. IB213877]|uniref:hypothetical protein n=1 Tax=Tenacibaculum sp. IB213877 TaxID=3097351 RepID=UPI002A59B11F|nr:hypothetical protein [Tenacibaculum sp. IB213877]MDY0779575.1 hypothetical protein [Tenacibaculum sp. IB213877]